MAQFSSLLCICAGVSMGSVDSKGAEVVNLKHLKDHVYSPVGYYSSLFAGIFYVGSDDEFDYLVIRHGKKTVKTFKIKRDELSIKLRMKIESSEKKWVNITPMFPFPQEGR